jgi:MFS family permease
MQESSKQHEPNGISRWIVLIMTCFGLFGQFYAFDNPSALNEQLREHMLERTSMATNQYDYYFNLLYSVYSLPNILLPLILGMAVDRCGCRLIIVTLGACVVIGHALFAAGVGFGSWSTMIAGRVVFGLGGESIQIAQNCLLFRLFKGREVAFALGLNLSIARGGSVLNDVLSPWAASQWGVVGACWLGTFLCVLSFGANIWSVVEDKRITERTGLPDAVGDEDISFREIFQLPRIFWGCAGLCVALYCAILPFNNIASAFFVETKFYGLPLPEAQQKAGNAMSIMFLVSAIGTPPFGALVDTIGMRAHFMLFSAILAACTYTAVSMLPPAAMMLCLGIVYTVFAGALWPTFALTVSERQLGTAYGVATALQNGGLCLVPMLVGHLQASAGPGDFHSVMRLFAFFGILGVVCSFDILRENATGKAAGVLSLPSNMIKVEKLDEKTNLVDTSAKAKNAV